MNDRTPHILIVNVHSQANAGDHAIVLGQLQLLKKIFPAARLVVSSRTPRLDRPLLAARGVTVIPPIFDAPSGSSGKWLPWGKMLLSLVFPLQALTFLRRLGQADLVMACGGGYFFSTRRIPGFTFWQNYLHLRLAVLFKKEVVFFPQSYGPLRNSLSRRLLGRLLDSKRVRAVFVREAISLAEIDGIVSSRVERSKIRFCPDMAFYYSSEPETIPPALAFADLPSPRIALALRDWHFPKEKAVSARRSKKEAYIEGVVAACLELHLKYGASFFIFCQAQGPSSAEDDRRISGYVHERLCASIPVSHLRFCKTDIGTSPAVFIHLLHQADMLVTSRMHAAIFAFLAGAPAVVIGYQHKSQGILQSLNLGNCSLPVEQTSKATLLPLCENILQNRGEWKERIRLVIPGIRETIEAKFLEIFN